MTLAQLIKRLQSMKSVIPAPPRANLSLNRRELLLSGVAAAAGAAMATSLSQAGGQAPAEFLRPPGAVDEERFLADCLRCGFCTWTCPTGVIQPAGLEAGPEGILTPVMKMQIGYCVFCTDCSGCPKNLLRRYRRLGGIKPKIGVAAVDRGPCRSLLRNRTCTVCYEACQDTEKAITLRPASEGNGPTVMEPVVNSDRCVGCGHCEHRCPAKPGPAIRVFRLDSDRLQPGRTLLSRNRARNRGH